jgi:hypothetical protein
LVIRKWNLECKIGGGYAKMARTYTLEIFGKLISYVGLYKISVKIVHWCDDYCGFEYYIKEGGPICW